MVCRFWRVVAQRKTSYLHLARSPSKNTRTSSYPLLIPSCALIFSFSALIAHARVQNVIIVFTLADRFSPTVHRRRREAGESGADPQPDTNNDSQKKGGGRGRRRSNGATTKQTTTSTHSAAQKTQFFLEREHPVGKIGRGVGLGKFSCLIINGASSRSTLPMTTVFL